MQKSRNSQHTTGIMRKYYQLILMVLCFVSIVSLLIYRHEYYRLRYVLEVLNFFGKPGLSEVEFCGPGYNATLLSDMMRNSSLEAKESPPIFQQLDDNFYVFSSFLRHNPRYKQLTAEDSFTSDSIVIGRNKIEPKFRCNFWFDKNPNKPKKGKFSFQIIPHQDSGYHLYIFHCGLQSDFGVPTALSFYSNNNDINPLNAPIFRLISVELIKTSLNDDKYVNNIDITACVVPNKIPFVSKETMIEFLAYHQLVGINQFIIYDSTISQDTIRRLDLISPDISRWRLTFFPLNYPFSYSKAYQTIKKAVEIDCMYRNSEEVNKKSSHLLTLSWDEFVVPRTHQNIKSFLSDFDLMKTYKKIGMETQLFCLNQQSDPKTRPELPEFLKKTHKYDIEGFNETVTINYIDANLNISNHLSNNFGSKQAQHELIAVHKYANCFDENSFTVVNSFLSTKPNRFEGAMLRFADSLQANKIYRMFKGGQIWDKTTTKLRDML